MKEKKIKSDTTIDSKQPVIKRKFRCNCCGATRIWLHNWAVSSGSCDKTMIADYQRGETLEQVLSFYKTIKEREK